MAHWIWISTHEERRNVFVLFRRSFEVKKDQKVVLKITASTRYRAFLNGHILGEGPIRGWPDHYFYDQYDLTASVQRGRNVLLVLVQYLGEGTMQWIPVSPGLLATIELHHGSRTEMIGTDQSWKVREATTYIRPTPRISIQQGFEEQFDAGRDIPESHDPDYDDSSWPQAVILSEHEIAADHLTPRPIPFLTAHRRHPVRLDSIQEVQPVRYVWSMNLKPMFNPKDRSAHFMHTCAYLYTRIYAPQSGPARLIRWHEPRSRVRLNGSDIPAKTLVEGYANPVVVHELKLLPGWNHLLVDFFQRSHLTRFVAALDTDLDIAISWKGELKGESPWALVGPFNCPESQQVELPHFPFHNVPTRGVIPQATSTVAQRIWKNGRPDGVGPAALVQPIPADLTAREDVSARVQADSVRTSVEPGLSAAPPTPDHPLIINPEKETRVVFDFGRETVGFFEIDLEAAAGTVVDMVGVEHRDPDGRLLWTEGVNNSLRYICRPGRQTFRGFNRQALRWMVLTLRHVSRPVKIYNLSVIENLYPRRRVGAFQCSDPMLETIWEVGAHTLACCSEDTYVDCPAYEQVFWVGDARNEALVDWVVNGDNRLWHRCLLLAAQSLERSPLIESHVPSAWPIVLPAWTMLWLRSCREYYLFTGDRKGTEMLWPFVLQTLNGLANHLNPDGLFEISAWNMFDWAEMDTPDRGVVTHQNCLLVLVLREIAELARWLGKHAEAQNCTTKAGALAQAINRYLYDEARQAYVDARHSDGRLSEVLSQQTQTMALVSQVAGGRRKRKAWQDILQPPEDYIKAGSPFFLFFLLEALMQEKMTLQILQHIRQNWGMMIEQGATTFWEMWSGSGSRPTRSHCHGWSAAPTYFLSTYVLGVQPLLPGFASVRIEPHAGDLAAARGRIPTPNGVIDLEWQQTASGDLVGQVKVPAPIRAEIRPPTPGSNIEIVR